MLWYTYMFFCVVICVAHVYLFACKHILNEFTALSHSSKLFTCVYVCLFQSPKLFVCMHVCMYACLFYSSVYMHVFPYMHVCFSNQRKLSSSTEPYVCMYVRTGACACDYVCIYERLQGESSLNIT
jgi:hypothetical protein